MPFVLDNFVKLRPYSYHLTHRDNLRSIRAAMCLESADALSHAVGEMEHVRHKRRESVWIPSGSTKFHIRDQKPLHEGNIDLQGGWTFLDLVRELNRRVFFWPGTTERPSEYGLRHFQRYRVENPVVLKIPTRDLLVANAPRQPEFCAFNSGSPRYTNGRASPRGPETFRNCAEFNATSGAVVEVVFVERAILPPFEAGTIRDGNWVTIPIEPA